MLLSFIIIIVFLMVALETSYLRMYWTDLQQIFKLGTRMGGYDHYDVLFAIAKGRCYGDQFLA